MRKQVKNGDNKDRTAAVVAFLLISLVLLCAAGIAVAASVATFKWESDTVSPGDFKYTDTGYEFFVFQ